MFDRDGLIEKLTEEIYRRVQAEQERDARLSRGSAIADLIGAGADRVGIRPGGAPVAASVG